MRIAVIGAGIVGVSTAYELVADGHQVTVFERRGSVAEESSFASGGLAAPAWVQPWARPGLPAQLWRQLLRARAPLRLERPLPAQPLRWLWRWWRASQRPVHNAQRPLLHQLARYSQQRLHTLLAQMTLEHEQSQGCLVLLRHASALTALRAELKWLAELGADFRLVDARRAREIEPGLNPDAPLHAAIHLPGAHAGNCRQFAHQLKAQAQRRGAVFHFQRAVLGITPGAQPQLRHHGTDGRGEVEQSAFDAVVVCAALGSPALLAPLGLRLPLAPVHGYTLTAPLRVVEGYPRLGPQAAVVDEQLQVSICRLGQRVRLSGDAALGGRLSQLDDAPLRPLYQALDDWFPGCAQLGQAQRWKGARATLPDGALLLGAAPTAGIWLNLGHAEHGWTLACGAARVLADQISGRPPALATAPLGLAQWTR